MALHPGYQAVKKQRQTRNTAIARGPLTGHNQAMSTPGRSVGPGMRTPEIWVAGYPGPYGGADTELDHQIDLWLNHGVRVNLVPAWEPDAASRAALAARGAVTHAYRDDIFAGKLVVSYCNGAFLRRLPRIYEAGPPRCVIWANCMTWTFPHELECHRQGLISLFIFQSEYQRLWLVPELRAVRPVQELEGYRPYFSMRRWSPGPGALGPGRSGYYGIGRVSRDDAAKYPADLWETFSRVRAPLPVKSFVLGWGPRALGKCGMPEDRHDLDWMLWAPTAVPAQQFFGQVHTLMHQTGGSRENWPRVAFEAWASGVAVLAECDYAWPELIEDGETGILCRTSEDFAQHASELAFDEARRKRITLSAMRRLLAEHCDGRGSFAPWQSVL
jgi:glycosyltransferase involved in cell wall biosynthesis